MSCNTRYMCGDCDLCYPLSFASHPRAENWSERNELTAREVFKKSNLKFWFQCLVCLHEFEACPYNVKIDKFCGFCSQPTRRLCWDLSCDWCYDRSFASHPRSLYWSTENSVSPRSITLNSNSEFWFDCSCGHIVLLKISHVARGSWCPVCSIPGKVLCDYPDCDHCFSRSFASHTGAQSWSSSNKKTPREVFLMSNTKYLFNCGTCNNEYEIPPCDIVRGRGCGICYKKTERKLMHWLKQILEASVTHQPAFDWCRSADTNRKLPFDFSVPDLRILIELDGLQHHQNVNKNWAPVEEQQERDDFKMRCALANGWTVIRVLQEDVFADKGDWADKLQRYLEKEYDGPRAFTIRTGNPLLKLRKYHRELLASRVDDCVIEELD